MGLSHHDHSGSVKHTCPALPSGPQYGVTHVAGPFNFHVLTAIICGVLTAVTLLVSGVHIALHATHFSNPVEQVKIIRIITLVPVFALVYLVVGAVPTSAIYIQRWADFYESVAMASYFLLLVAYVCPVAEQREGFFDNLPHQGGPSSLAWYRRTWFFVFQYIPVSFLCAVATDITQAVGVYCENSSKAYFAHIWITVIRSISVALAFIRLFAFFKRLHQPLKQHHIASKLTAIKGIVFLTWVQSIVFTILTSQSLVHPSAKLSYDDIYYGIQSILICSYMVLFAAFHFYAYSVRPYILSTHGSAGMHYQGGLFGCRAFAMAVNPMETLAGVGMMVGYASAGRGRGSGGPRSGISLTEVDYPAKGGR